MPSLPNTTSSTSDSNPTTMMTRPASRATSRGESTIRTPKARALAHASATESQPITRNPLAIRCPAIGLPILPRPMSPTVSMEFMSVDLKGAGPDQRPQSRRFARDERAEFFRRAALDLEAELLQAAAHVRRLQRAIHAAVQLLDEGARRLRRGHEADPQRRVGAFHALFLESRDLRQGRQ